jgi:hypothetical protein
MNLLKKDKSKSPSKSPLIKRKGWKNLKKITTGRKKESRLQFIKRVFVNLHLNTKFLNAKEPDLVHPILL